MYGYPTPIDDLVVAAANQLPAFPYTEDMNQGSEIGMGLSDFTTNGLMCCDTDSGAGYVYASAGYGSRSSSATAYLTDGVYARENLDVLVQYQVLKLISNDTTSDSPSFTTVQFAADADSKLTDLLLHTPCTR